MMRFAWVAGFALLGGGLSFGGEFPPVSGDETSPYVLVTPEDRGIAEDKVVWIIQHLFDGIGLKRCERAESTVTDAALEKAKIVFVSSTLKPKGALAETFKRYRARGGKVLKLSRYEFKTEDHLFARVAKEVPSEAAHFEALHKANLARRAEELKTIAAMPGKAGEDRRMSFHDTEWSPVINGETWSWDRTIAYLKDAGFTKTMWGQAYPNLARYHSKVLPVSKKLAEQGGDPLDEYVAACKKHGIKCGVALRCFSTKVVRGEETEPSWEKMIAEDPTLIAVDRDGKQKLRHVCPTHPGWRKKILEVVRELCEKKPDCLSLDFIRFLDTSYCYCDRCKKGIEAHGGDVVAFRKETIQSIVRQMRATMKETHPACWLEATVLQNARTYAGRVGQDWEAWCKEGLLDVVVPMDYAFKPGEFVGLIRNQREMVGKVPMQPIFGPTLWPDDGHVEMRAAETIREAREMGTHGFAWFCFDDRTVRIIEALKAGPLKR